MNRSDLEPRLVHSTEEVLRPLLDWLETLADAVQRVVPGDGVVGAKDLDVLPPLIESMLRKLKGLAKGCGFMAAPDAVVGSRLFQQWWQLDAKGFQRLLLDFDETSEFFYDYTRKEYFAVPMSTGRPHAEGPYVDYLGIGEYIFTFTRPVVVDGKVLGVVGADVALEALQRALLNRDAGDDPVALVNHKGRVIFSTDVELESGSLLRTPQFAARNSEIHSRANLVSSVWPCGTNWAVVALNRPLGGPA